MKRNLVRTVARPVGNKMAYLCFSVVMLIAVSAVNSDLTDVDPELKVSTELRTVMNILRSNDILDPKTCDDAVAIFI